MNMDFGTLWFYYGSPTLAVIICILNSIQIILLFKRFKCKRSNRSRQKASLLFLLSLTVSGSSVGLTMILVKILAYLIDYNVISNKSSIANLYNILLFIFLRFSLIISVFNLLALTADRLLAVRNPFRYTMLHTRNVITAILVIWILSIGIVTGYYYFSVQFFSSQIDLRYSLLTFPITIIPAAVAMSVCYIFVFREIRIQRKQFRGGTERGKLEGSTTISFQMHLVKRESKVARFVACAVLTFILCWLSLAILGIIKASGAIYSDAVSDPIFVLAFCNSAANPLIYFGFKRQLCNRCKGLKCEVFRC